MRNRAKCKLCGDIIESFHHYDFVTCKCGEISVDGGLDVAKCAARDWKNFLRVDDDGNEIIPKVVDTRESLDMESEEKVSLSLEDKIDMLDRMVKTIENLPKNAMETYINHYDLYSFMAIILSILRSK